MCASHKVHVCDHPPSSSNHRKVHISDHFGSEGAPQAQAPTTEHQMDRETLTST